MSIKAIFFDIDQTLYDHQSNRILPSSLAMLTKLKKAGYKLALCSGRTLEMAQQLPVFDLFDWDGYIGGFGVSVYDENLNSIYQSYFCEEQYETIYQIAKTYHITLNPHGKDEYMTQPLNPYSKAMFDHFHCATPVVKAWQHKPIQALSAYEKEGFDWSIFNHIEGVSLHSPYPTCMDFIQEGIDKASGIQQMLHYWQLDGAEFMAFGDSDNDVAMLEAATIGVAMENATPKCKAASDVIIGPCHEDSIATYLDNVLSF